MLQTSHLHLFSVMKLVLLTKLKQVELRMSDHDHQLGHDLINQNAPLNSKWDVIVALYRRETQNI